MTGGEKLALKEHKYLYNQSFLKSYGNGKYKLVTIGCTRNSGIDCEDWSYTPKGTVNNSKLENNIVRAKSKLFEYAFCNDWEFMITCTINDKLFNRYQLKEYHEDLSRTIRNANRYYEVPISYMFVPERHSDGAWHEHGLISHIPKSELIQLSDCMYLPYALIERLHKGEELFIWDRYQAKYGYCVLSRIKSFEGVSRYVTKYLTKDTMKNVSEVGAHIYYCSKGLKSADTIKRGSITAMIEPDFIGEYASIKWFDSVSDEQSLINSLFG